MPHYSYNELNARFQRIESYINEFTQFKDIIRNEVLPRLQQLDIATQNLTKNMLQDKKQLDDYIKQVNKLTNDMQRILEEDYEN